MDNLWRMYVLECADGTLYTGISTDIRRRLRQHNGELKGGAKYTRPRRPVELLLQVECGTKSRALKLEYRFKKLSRRQKLELILAPHSRGWNELCP